MFWFSLIFRQEKCKYWDDVWPFTFSKVCSRDHVKLRVFKLNVMRTITSARKTSYTLYLRQIVLHFKVNDSQGRKDNIWSNRLIFHPFLQLFAGGFQESSLNMHDFTTLTALKIVSHRHNARLMADLKQDNSVRLNKTNKYPDTLSINLFNYHKNLFSFSFYYFFTILLPNYRQYVKKVAQYLQEMTQSFHFVLVTKMIPKLMIVTESSIIYYSVYH